MPPEDTQAASQPRQRHEQVCQVCAGIKSAKSAKAVQEFAKANSRASLRQEQVCQGSPGESPLSKFCEQRATKVHQPARLVKTVLESRSKGAATAKVGS